MYYVNSHDVNMNWIFEHTAGSSIFLTTFTPFYLFTPRKNNKYLSVMFSMQVKKIEQCVPAGILEDKWYQTLNIFTIFLWCLVMRNT